MTRRSAKGLVYYACRTYQEKSRVRCTKHSIRLDVLEQAVLVSIQKQIELVSTLSDIIDEINKAPVIHKESERIKNLLEQKQKEMEKARTLLDGLYVDWKSGELGEAQYRRLKAQYEEKIDQLQETIEHLKKEYDAYAQGVTKEDPYLTAFLKYRNIQTLSRSLLVELVNAIYVHENGELEIEFNFADQYRRILEFVENNKKELYVSGGKTYRKLCEYKRTYRRSGDRRAQPHCHRRLCRQHPGQHHPGGPGRHGGAHAQCPGLFPRHHRQRRKHGVHRGHGGHL